MTSYIIILVTTPTKKWANKIAQLLIEKKLVACVNIIPEITSFYTWQNKLCQDKESLLIIKTKKALFTEIENTIKKAHPYQVPEIISLPITKGSQTYLNWIDTVTAK